MHVDGRIHKPASENHAVRFEDYGRIRILELIFVVHPVSFLAEYTTPDGEINRQKDSGIRLSVFKIFNVVLKTI